MNILKSLTIKNLKLNKKRTIVTIIGIILATALIVALSSLVFSFKASLVEYQKTSSGDYHYKFSDVPQNEITYIRNNRKVEDICMTQRVGYARLNGSQNASKPYLCLQAFSKNAFKKLAVHILEGRLPEKEDEIVISNHIKTNGRVKYEVGDKITLDIGKRVIDGCELNQFNPYYEDTKESIEETFSKTYTIVGIVERPINAVEPYSAPGYTIITVLNEKENEKNVDVYARYTKEGLKDSNKTTADILGIDEKTLKGIEWEIDDGTNSIKYSVYPNSYLISYETLNFSDSVMTMIYVLAIIITVIIIVTSIFCIRNSFAISITEKTKQYGMLASVGTTSKQIKKNVYFESIVLAVIGIPLGIMLGLLASFVLIKICNILLKNSMSFDLIYEVSGIAILVSVVLSLITCLMSARSSAKKASKITPIEAIRGNDDIKIKRKKIKATKIIKRIFGVGGDIAYKNLKRNNKKYRTTVVSIVVCVAVFIATSSFVNLAFRAVKMEIGEMDYNISVIAIDNNEENVMDKLKQISMLDNVNKYSIQRETMFLTEKVEYTEEYKNQNYTNGECYINMISIGEDEYNRYIKELGLNYDKCKNGAILINKNISKVVENEKNVKKIELDIYKIKRDDILKGNISKDLGKAGIEASLKICAVTDKTPMAINNSYNYNGYLIVSDEFMNKYENEIKEYKNIYIDSNNPDKLQDNIEKITNGADNYDIYNVNETARQLKSMYLLVAIFLYGFIIVIALIGVTNIFNTITTSMELRAKEFAMLKSIGMTSKEFNKMIKLESFFYGTKSLIIGIPIGIGLSYAMFKAFSEGIVFSSYELPINGIVISLMAVFLLVWTIMKFSLNKINKQNIIETIRRDNI